MIEKKTAEAIKCSSSPACHPVDCFRGCEKVSCQMTLLRHVIAALSMREGRSPREDVAAEAIIQSEAPSLPRFIAQWREEERHF